MADIPGNTATTRTIGVGDTLSDSLEVIGDHDWIKIQLTAGQSVSISLDGLTLVDPYLRIRDSSGNVIYENDDISSGVNRDSLLAFTATYTGTYYIDVAAWEPPPDSPDFPGYTGTYTLSVANYTPPPLATVEQVANQLVSGYWAGDTHHFNVGPGGSITVNLSGLTSAGQNLARAALATWTDIIGVSFPEVLTGGQIVFDDNEEGAFSTGNWTGAGIITSSFVNVSTAWIGTYGSGLNTYSFQTYIHEIGHALGLGHAGNYNETARYPFEALFQNDGWPVSIMSYFAQGENTYFAGQGFDENFIATPMMADIYAMSMLYGLSTTTRVGNTTYGPSWSGNMGALCIFDSGGIDTIDVTGLGGSHRIDLNPGSFSNVLGEVGNVSIAIGVIIENAVGGSGNDTLIGNGVANSLIGGQGNDTIVGGGGNDSIDGGPGSDNLTGGVRDHVFIGNPSQLSGDFIADFSAGDRIIFTGVNSSNFSFNLTGSTLSFSGGSLTLTGFAGQLQASAAAEGGVQLTVVQTAVTDVRNDFNGDGRSDILWRDGGGTLSEWLGQSNGSFAWNPSAMYQLPAGWSLVAAADVNGDGRDDILWRDNAGVFSQWLGQANGSFAWNPNAIYQTPTSWQLEGGGDFNGDGRDDILWRDASGTLSEWLGQANGSFAWNPNAIYQTPTSWQLEGSGDFNGDGRDDILWRDAAGTLSEWLGQADGAFAWNPNSNYQVPASWILAGTGDFNGDGRDDILWRDQSGALSEWLGQANGTFVGNPNATYQTPASWELEDTGDFNGDGRDDILWRDASGTLSEWLGQANGSFAWNPNAIYQTPTDWDIQPDFII